MSRYRLNIKKSAEKELDRLPEFVFGAIRKKMLGLADNPRPANCKKLRGTEEYRLRVGDYRILYIVDDARKIVEIMAIGHRKEVYR